MKNTSEQKKELEALKAQVNHLLKACKLYGDEIPYGDSICDHSALGEADTIVLMTPEQCLNSIKISAVTEWFSIYGGECTSETLKEYVKVLT